MVSTVTGTATTFDRNDHEVPPRCEGATNCSNNDIASELTGGCTFAKGLSGDLGYVCFGEARATFAGTGDAGVRTASARRIQASPGDLVAKASAQALALCARCQLPLGDTLFADARPGVSAVRAKVTATIVDVDSASETHTKAAPYYGLGVGFNATKRMKVRLGAIWTHADFGGVTTNIHAITPGGRYDFRAPPPARAGAAGGPAGTLGR